MRAWCPRCDAVRPGATACPACGTTLATLDDPGTAGHPPDLPPPEAAAGPPPPRSRLRIALAAATLVDRDLRRRSTGTLDDTRWLAARRDCPGCQLRVTCVDCATMRIVGSAYRRRRVLIAVEGLDRVELTALNPSRRRVQVTDENGFTELPAWIDGSGGTAVISIAGELLAAAWPDSARDSDPMDFDVLIEALTEQPVRGSWTIRQAGG